MSGNIGRRSNYATGGPVVKSMSFDDTLVMNIYHTWEIRPLIHLTVPGAVVSYSRALGSIPFEYGCHQYICILRKMLQTFKFIELIYVSNIINNCFIVMLFKYVDVRKLQAR
jgi:hypothetical protein